MTSPDAALQDALEQSYAAFSTMPHPKSLTASPLRNAGEILASLSVAPLRELTGEQLGPYSGWALTTVGDDRAYRHFLPRIFELSLTDISWIGTEPPVIASKLNRAAWREWPDIQQGAVLGFFRSAFRSVVERHPNSGHSAMLWFCALIMIGDSPSLNFERWRSSRSPNAALQMASFMIDEAKHLRRHREVRGPYWEDVSLTVRQDVAERLTSGASKAFLQAVASRVSEEDRFMLLDAALAELQ